MTSWGPGRRRAQVLLGAAVGAAAAGLPPGPPTPTPGIPDACVVLYERSDGPTRGPAGEPAGFGPFAPLWTPDEHAAAVRAVRGLIARGEVYQVNVVGAWQAELLTPGGLDLAALGGAWAGSMAGEGWSVACASPEMLVTACDGVATTEPVKGTARVADDPGGALLRASAKDRAEHVMIVDLERNDLGRVAVTGSVRVEELYALRRWAHLWHAHSRVTATLRPGTSLGALLAAFLPGGSVTGAPKVAAVRALQQLEVVGRGPAMGALGWVEDGGSVRLGLTIRTAGIDESTSRCVVWAGGGVTWSSDPGAEVAEAAAKAAPLLEALAAGARD